MTELKRFAESEVEADESVAFVSSETKDISKRTERYLKPFPGGDETFTTFRLGVGFIIGVLCLTVYFIASAGQQTGPAENFEVATAEAAVEAAEMMQISTSSSSDYLAASLFKKTPSKKEFFNVNVSNWKMKKEGKCRKAAAGPALIENGIEIYPQVLQKKGYSNKTRFVFIVGLEGTGHHLWNSVWNRCKEHSICDRPPTIDGFVLSALSMRKGLAGVYSSRSACQSYVKNFIKKLPKAIQRRPRTYIINTIAGSHWVSGEMSYPNFSPSCRDLAIPDVRLMAELFESVGMDFRILVVRRNPLDVLISTTIHRHYGNTEWNGRLYASIIDKAIIGEQLARLDPAFYECLVYEELRNIPDKIGKFINVDGKRNGNWTFQHAVQNVFHHSHSKDYKNPETFVRNRFSASQQASYRKLVAATNRLESFCKDKSKL